MTTDDIRTDQDPSGKTVISIDGMGGDAGPEAIVGGLEISAEINPHIHFILHGDSSTFAPLLKKKPELAARVALRNSDKSVSMHDKPSTVLRNGKGTSMWNALESVKNNEATVAVSCGNTGALMALSMFVLRKLPGVKRPAIAVLWPKTTKGHNVLLDLGADIKADAEDLMKYAIMGASYARNGLGVDRPRVGVLNIGTEDHKGRPELAEAAELITAIQDKADMEYIGFAEGSDMSNPDIDVIVTDGFTGNVALKAGEGTAKLIRGFLKDAFTHTPLAKVAAVFASASLRRLSNRIDPSRQNGGVFLGLNGTVVKSHGGANATGVSAAIKLAFKLADSGFTEKVAARVASGISTVHSDQSESDKA